MGIEWFESRSWAAWGNYFLVDRVLPEAPYRQWVLTFPWGLRFLLAVDRRFLTEMLRAFLRTLFAWQRRRGRQSGIDDGHPGAATSVDPAPRSATVVALKPSTVFCLSRAILCTLRDKGPPVAIGIISGVIGQVTRRIRNTTRQIEKRRATGSLAGGRQPRKTGRPIQAPGTEGKHPRLYKGPVDLSGVDGLGDLTVEDLVVLSTVVRKLEYPAGSLLCAEGEAGDSCFIVVRGDVEVIKAVEGDRR